MNPTMKRLLLEPQGIVKRGLVAWYDFADPAGSQILTDKSGYGNHGQNGSTAGADTNDVTFDGTKAVFGGDDCVNLGNACPLTDSFYIEFVLKPASFLSQVNVIARWIPNRQFKLSINQYDATFLLDVTGVGSGDNGRTSSSVITNTKYWLIAGQYIAGQNADIHLFVNGKNVDGTVFGTIPPALYTGGGKSINLGCVAVGDTHFIGDIAYGAIYYNKVMSDNEIKQNHKAIKKMLANRGIVI